jgi:LCP family protein required for cell wall assembly
MAVPRHQPPARSASAAVVLSFLVPGLGQLYARRWRAALGFALPVVLFAAIAVHESSQGPAHLVGRLLDPAIGVALVIALVGLAAWRIAAVLDAWRTGRRTLLSWTLVPSLVLVIVGTHGFGAINAAALVGAGERIFGADTLLDDPPPVPPGVPAGSSAPGASSEPPPSVDPQATVPPGYEDYPDEVFPEPEPVINAGPAPAFDIAAIDEQADGLLNVLLVGIDWKPGRDHRLTDTMIVVSVNADTGAVYMFSFPRDVAEFPLYDGGTYSGKLNSFAGYAHKHRDRYPDGGMQSLAYQLGFLLGVPIDYYAAVDIPGFEKVVRAVGGVTIHNDRPIDDSYTGFKLPVGEHRLNAEEALMYVRSRKGSSDFARARRQQVVLAALRREMLRPAKLPSLPAVVDAVADVVRTNFPRDQLGELLALAERVEDQPTNSWVFKFPEWAHHPPRTETNGRSLMFLRLDLIEQLSLELFGERSLYSR